MTSGGPTNRRFIDNAIESQVTASHERMTVVRLQRAMTEANPDFTTQRLAWRDISLGVINLAEGRRMRLTLGLGSGLSRRPGERKGTVWAIADRGPNLKIKSAIKRYGLEHLRPLAKVDGAKVMPRPDIGPTICQLRVQGSTVSLVRRIPLRGASGRAISGLPIPSAAADVEPAFDVEGAPLGIDPSGADTEAIVALSDGTFWIGDEYGPSLLHVGPEGQVLQRWVPKGLERTLDGADYVVKGVLPAIALRRRINRGFEALAASPDERWLYAVFQSPLAHPDAGSFKRGRHVRVWKLDALTGAVAAQFLYPLDEPASFQSDRAAGEVGLTDVKVCEAAAIGLDRLLMLERILSNHEGLLCALGPPLGCHGVALERPNPADARAMERRRQGATCRAGPCQDARALDRRCTAAGSRPGGNGRAVAARAPPRQRQ